MNLNSCISSIAHPVLLEHWCIYYRNLGIDNIDVVVNYNPRCHDKEHYARTLALLEKYNINYEIWEGEFIEIPKTRKVMELRQKLYDPEDWCIMADLDEFVNLNKGAIKHIENSDADYYPGYLVDRIGNNGILEKYSLDTPLEETFPLKVKLGKFLKTITHKIPVSKAKVRVYGGHHRVIKDKPLIAGKFMFRVNHYKWNYDIVEYIKNYLLHEIDYENVMYRISLTKFIISVYESDNRNQIDLNVVEQWGDNEGYQREF